MHQIAAIRAFTDNYIWAIRNASGQTVVVDPGQAEPVERWLTENGSTLAGILITHHHWDHTGGIAELCTERDIPVYGPDNAQIKGITRRVGGGESFRLDPLNLEFEVLAVPGHTLDHLAYYNAGEQLLFCGDTLFHCGCGRLFEGTPEQMSASLGALAALPADTRVFCTHEYTLSNMSFAAAVEPTNADLQVAMATARNVRADDGNTLPSTIGEQRLLNPFLRCAEAPVVAAAVERGADGTDPVSVFATLRRWKDSF